MYDMFVVRNNKEASTLKNWIPVVVEPAPNNFESLTKKYADVQKKTNLTCPLLSNWAVSYESNSECTFCQFNVSNSSDQACKDYPDWVKYQLVTLECGFSKKYHAEHFELCIIQDKVDCGSIQNLLTSKFGFPDKPPIAMLQIDVEGYEKVLIPGMLNEFDSTTWPPIIHFEHKVLRERDIQNDWDHAIKLNDALQKRGYDLYDQGEDILAIRVK
jgi:hypothetical protein